MDQSITGSNTTYGQNWYALQNLSSFTGAGQSAISYADAVSSETSGPTSSAATSTPPVAGSGAVTSSPFQQLAADLQALVLQLQAASSAGTSSSAATNGTGTATTGTSDSTATSGSVTTAAGATAAASTSTGSGTGTSSSSGSPTTTASNVDGHSDGSTSTGKVAGHHHHHHHSAASDEDGANQTSATGNSSSQDPMAAVANDLINLLQSVGGQTSGATSSSCTGTSLADTSAASTTSGTSTSATAPPTWQTLASTLAQDLTAAVQNYAANANAISANLTGNNGVLISPAVQISA